MVPIFNVYLRTLKTPHCTSVIIFQIVVSLKKIRTAAEKKAFCENKASPVVANNLKHKKNAK